MDTYLLHLPVILQSLCIGINANKYKYFDTPKV